MQETNNNTPTTATTETVSQNTPVTVKLSKKQIRIQAAIARRQATPPPRKPRNLHEKKVAKRKRQRASRKRNRKH